MKQYNKKASLELSINAIVILILAITMLGLGLGFMRNIFGGATDQFQEMSGTVHKQMIDQMKDSGKQVELNRPKITVKKGDSDQIFIGLRNVKTDPVYFWFMNPPQVTQVTKDGGSTDAADVDGVDVNLKKSPTMVDSGKVVVIPINVETTSQAASATYYIDIVVCAKDSAPGTTTCDASFPPSGQTGERYHLELVVDLEV